MSWARRLPYQCSTCEFRTPDPRWTPGASSRRALPTLLLCTGCQRVGGIPRVARAFSEGGWGVLPAPLPVELAEHDHHCVVPALNLIDVPQQGYASAQMATLAPGWLLPVLRRVPFKRAAGSRDYPTLGAQGQALLEMCGWLFEHRDFGSSVDAVGRLGGDRGKSEEVVVEELFRLAEQAGFRWRKS